MTKRKISECNVIYELKQNSSIVKGIFDSKDKIGIFDSKDKIGVSNKSSFSFLSEIEVQLIQSYISSSNCRLLEIGSGEGWLASYLAENHECSVLGLDISRVAIERARMHAPEKYCSFLQTSMDEFDYKPGIFDVIYSIDSIHHSENINELFKKLYNSLNPNGFLIFTMWFENQEVRNSKVIRFLQNLRFLKKL